MLRPRIIPILLLQGEGLVKGVHFKDYKYVGDPINAVKIFSEKEVDEIIFLDISASKEGRTISPELIQKIADEAYMPFGVGGGIRSIETIRSLLSAGAEKVSLNTAAVETPCLISEAARMFGSQCIVVSIDVKRDLRGNFCVYTRSGLRNTGLDPIKWILDVERLGAGEILLNSIDRDGTMKGYDLDLIMSVTKAVKIPVIVCGGAGKVQDLKDAIHNGNASAAAAGSLFVFHGPKRAVLINTPSTAELETIWAQ
jgi:cyclase